MGHPRVAVLDGGLKKWKHEGFPMGAIDDQATEDDFNYKINTDRIWSSANV